ncbi:MAG: V-type ATP synthase subunit F [Candidatus Paceibacterota bacterium]
MNYKIAIIGPSDTVSLFKATGAEVFSATNSDETLEILKKLRKSTLSPDSTEKYAIVMVIENLLENIKEEELIKFTESPLPALLALPGLKGPSGISGEKLKKLAERAIGSNILG